jgi:hypothetical protein
VTIAHVDTSALLKRVLAEPESGVVRALLVERATAGALPTASPIAWLEVSRSLRRAGVLDVETLTTSALSGVADSVFTYDKRLAASACSAGTCSPRRSDARRARVLVDLPPR